jgi:hypothetical protein
MRRYYYAGAPHRPGSNLPSNMTGECEHQHRTPEAAQRCIDALDASIKRGHGQSAYCDRRVMVHEADGRRSVYVPSSTDADRGRMSVTYCAVCECRWVGKSLPTYAAAERDGDEHTTAMGDDDRPHRRIEVRSGTTAKLADENS